MKVEREALLKTLTVASLGLTKKEILEQSNAYIFTKDSLVSFNGEILTSVATPLPGIKGAVPAEELHRLVSKFPDAELTVKVSKGHLLIRGKGKRREGAIVLQKEVHLPYKDVPEPKEWTEAPEKLSGILLQAARCCGRDETQPMTTVVHVAGDRVESCDNYRLFRYEITTGLERDALIPATSLEALGGLAVEQISQTKTKGGGCSWLHLLLPDDHRVSIRCIKGEYPDLAPLLKLKDPHKVTLPSNLEDILARAEVMQESAVDASVSVLIQEGQISLLSQKETGWYRETKKIDYEGETLSFSVHPKFLQEVLAKKKAVLVAGDRMKLKEKEAVFVICLEVQKEGSE